MRGHRLNECFGYNKNAQKNSFIASKILSRKLTHMFQPAEETILNHQPEIVQKVGGKRNYINSRVVYFRHSIKQ